ncbi:NAD-glutamate dehydrogenase domain-containing protein, partial [Dactylosporangium sp. NPDC050688]|uniref:NAD-glutamate dehydrogenase domain-containing protein n=1 Tax=Dactylosporangium sp. NPDC050688 TaxID=3157217 RepID=UPI0033FF8579
RLRIQQILLAELNGIGVDYTTRVSESKFARVHLIVRTEPGNPPGDINVPRLTERLSNATRLWDDDFRLVLERNLDDEHQAKLLYQRYGGALSDTYKNEHTPYEAVQDVAKLELLDEPGQLVMHVHRRHQAKSDIRFKVLRYGRPMILSAVLPVLHSLGVRVTDERPYEIVRPDGTVYLYDFGLQLPPDARTITEVRPHLENAFSATWHGEAEVDGFNALALKAGLTWREVVVLRAYAKYLRQAGTVFSQDYMETTLLQYPAIASKLVDLFTARFDLRLQLSETARSEWSKEMAAAINEDLDTVTSLDQDRILRSFLHVIQATLRTSFFQRGEQGRPKSYTAFKLDPQSIPDLP